MNSTLKRPRGSENSSRPEKFHKAKLMSVQFEMFNPMTCEVLPNAISSLASADGVTRSNSPDGPMMSLSGREAVHASHSAPAASNWVGRMRGIYGRRSAASSIGRSLQSCLENRLQANLAGLGAPEYALTWKRWDMRQGRQICALRASAHRTSGNGCSGEVQGWPTPRANDGTGAQQPPNRQGGESLKQMAAWATPTSRDHKDSTSDGTAPTNGLLGRQAWLAKPGQTLNSSNAEMENRGALNPAHSRWLMGYPVAWDSCGATAMQSCRNSRRGSSKRSVKQGK